MPNGAPRRPATAGKWIGRLSWNCKRCLRLCGSRVGSGGGGFIYRVQARTQLRGAAIPRKPVVGLDPATSDPIERFAWWRGMPTLYFYLRRVLWSKLASLSLGHAPLEFDIPNIIAPTPGARNKNQCQIPAAGGNSCGISTTGKHRDIADKHRVETVKGRRRTHN
jgi:hypothetical protein